MKGSQKQLKTPAALHYHSHCSLFLADPGHPNSLGAFKEQVGERWDAGEVSQPEERAEGQDS